jgi:hypothetical protein
MRIVPFLAGYSGGVGTLDWLRRIRDESRYEGLGDPEPGVRIFKRADWKAHHVERYVQRAQEAGHHAEIASPQEEAQLARDHEAVGFRIGTAWWVFVWDEGQPRPDPYEPMQKYLKPPNQNHLPEQNALVDAGDRLDEHITDVPFDPEFRSVLRASAAVGFEALQRFEADRLEPDAQPGPETRALLEAWRSPAAADRAVRTAAWLVFGAAIGLLLGIDRRQEAVDAASVAIPLSPMDLSWVLDHVDSCFRWMQDTDVEVQVASLAGGEVPDVDAMMGEWGAPVTLNSWMWLCDAVLQREPLSEPPPLDDDTITWGIELAVATFDDLSDVWVRLEEARGAG